MTKEGAFYEKSAGRPARYGKGFDTTDAYHRYELAFSPQVPGLQRRTVRVTLFVDGVAHHACLCVARRQEGKDNVLVKVQPLLERFGDWRLVIGEGLSDEDAELLRGHQRTGRPLGSMGFIEGLKKLLNRVLRTQKRGRTPACACPHLSAVETEQAHAHRPKWKTKH